MIDIVRTVANVDDAPELHLARLLILLNAFSTDREPGSIQGITKLAKLDFLLRYPILLQRALQAKGQPVANVKLEDHEKMSVEATMVRYRFGPWDHRYREYLNIMSAKQLVNVTIEGRTTIIALTSVGQAQAKKLGAVSNFEAYVRRTKLLKANFDMTATNLMRFIYNTFPEIISLKKNAPIIP